MTEIIKCAHCGLDILTHVTITYISCLSALSGEIEVYRDKIKENEN